jgi:uncharacterized protein (TIGR00251 family)
MKKKNTSVKSLLEQHFFYMLRGKPLPISPLFQQQNFMNSSTLTFPWLTVSSISSPKLQQKKGAKSSADSSTTKKSFQCSLSVRVTPGSKKDQLSVSESELCLKISAPPVEGKANEAVIEFFEDLFKASSSFQFQDVQLVAGMTSRNKTIQFSMNGVDEGMNAEHVGKCVVQLFKDFQE